MASTTISNTVLTALKERVVSMASYGRYKIGSTWYDASLNSNAIQQNGSVHITFYVRPATPGDMTPATAFRICDRNGVVLFEREEEVAFTQYVSTILYRFKIGVSAAGT